MKKSVAIIAKGPSVLKCTKDFVDSFDAVAICNWPPFDGYEKYIGTRANYHFINAGEPWHYRKDLINNLGLKKFFNTQANHLGTNTVKELPDNLLPDHDVEYEWDFGFKTREKYEAAYGIWPSTGVMALDYFLSCDEFDKIALIGFDFYRTGADVYYFPKEKVKETLHYLWNNSSYTTDGKVLEKAYKGHGGDDVIKIINELIKQSGKEVSWVQ